MDFQQLNKRLKALGVKPKDDLRASLYIDHLESLKTYFSTILPTYFKKVYLLGYNAKYSFVEKAVTSNNLLNELAEILEFYVAPAVAADLRRAYETVDKGGLGHGGARGWTYRDYFDNVILNKDSEKYQANLKAFRTMYPITAHALKQLHDNFERNIVEMCERVIADRDLLIEFYKDLYSNRLNIASLDEIKSTGSDFHKGGKQVLILTFAITYKKARPNPQAIEKLKVVYKPSDLEIDCLIAGDSSVVNRVLKKEFMKRSLFEIYNLRVDECKKQLKAYGEHLDTYRILPRNFISAHKGQYPLPIREAYGYIQYLNQEVSISRRMIFDLEFLEVGKSDFLIFPDNKKKTELINQFYYKSGAFVALACSFSIIDMHCENIRVMGYSPYAIDLEVSLTQSVNDIEETALIAKGREGNIGGIDGLFTYDKWGWVTKDANGSASIQEERNPPLKYHQNRLWIVAGEGIKTPISVNDSALLHGLDIGMAIVSECQKNRDFDSWFKRIQNVVVRYPMVTTGNLESLRDMCFVKGLSKGKQLLPTLEKLLPDEYDKLQREYRQGDNPNFIFPVIRQTGEDYKNLDIPVFYHRIGTLDVVDSMGKPVRFPIVDSSGKPVKLPDNFEPNRDTFFAKVPTEDNVKRKQVDILEREGFDIRLKTIKESFLGTRPQRMINDEVAIHSFFPLISD